MSSAPLRPDHAAPAPSLDPLPAASLENRTKPAPPQREGAPLSTDQAAPPEVFALPSTSQNPQREPSAPLTAPTAAPQEVSAAKVTPHTRPRDVFTTDEASPETFLEVSTREGAFPATPQTLAEDAHAPGEACCGTCARFAFSRDAASARNGTHDPQTGETNTAETSAPRAETAPLLRAEPGHLTLRVSWLRNRRPPEEHRPQQASLIVGRKSPPADIAVDNQTLSRQQLKLFFQEGGWWVEDLNSSCGTWFHSGEKIHRATPVPEGARICCGDVELSLLPDEGTR